MPGQIDSQRLGFLIRQTDTRKIRRPHGGAELSTWAISDKRPCLPPGRWPGRGARVRWLALPTSLAKEGPFSGGDHDQAGEQVPDGSPVWDAGDKHPISACGVERGRLASREGGKVRGGVSERNVADSRDKRSCPRLGFDFVFPFLFLFLF